MSKWRFSSTASLLFLFILAACSKDSEPGLTSKVWKRSLTDRSASSNPSGKILYQSVADCEKDDTYTFVDEGALFINVGTTQCNANDTSSITAYSFSADKKNIFIKNNLYQYIGIHSGQLKLATPLASGTGYDFMVIMYE